MNNLFKSIILLLFVTTSFSQELKIVLPSDVYKDYEKFLAGRDPHAITDYTGEFSRRDVVEVVLMLKALRKGGIEVPIKISQLDSYARILIEVEKGNFALCANTVWKRDIDTNKYFVSNETLRDGEFYAGLYANLENKSFFEITKKHDIKKFKAVSNSAWSSDWQVLSSLELSSLQDVKQWEQMVRMVHHKRVDFLLAPFQTNKDMTLKFENITLYPLKGYKIALPGARVFIASKKYPGSVDIFKAFNQGLDELIQSGEIQKAYEQAGFINKATTKWEILN